MANLCWYVMRITGKAKVIGEFVGCMKGGRVGKVVSCYIQSSDFGLASLDKVDQEKTYQVTVEGNCKWSVASAMVDLPTPNILSLSKQFGLTIEIYSSETGCCFQEHLMINKGELVTNETVEYTEYSLCEYGSLEQLNRALGSNFAEDDVDGEYVKEGGFGDYFCVFCTIDDLAAMGYIEG